MNRFRCFYTVLLGVSLFFVSVNLFSQEIDQTYMFDYHNAPSMNYYLDLADRQSAEQKWHQYARFGMNAAIAEWEKDVLILQGEDFDLVTLRAEAETELNEVIESRFSKWMADQFFSNVSPQLLGELSSEIEALNSMYLYSPQADGSIMYKTTVGYDDIYADDPSGNSEVLIKGEKTLWAEGVKAGIDELLEVWSEKMTTAFSELKTSAEDPEIQNKLESAYNHNFDSYRDAFQRQLYRLYNLEQSRFSELRLNDRNSLQHQSETETAAYITDKLITQTRTELDAGLDRLVSGLNAEVGEVRTDGGIINADEWQESFQYLLEQGLRSWDSAEEELLMERVQWEQVSGREIVEGEKVWAEAFNQLLEKRSEWIAEFRITLENGNLLWAKESYELESAIEKAVAGIDDSISNSEASLQGRMDNLLGMLLQSVNMMRTARTGWEYWMDQFDEGEKGSFNSGNVEFDTGAMQLSMFGIKPELSDAQRNANAAYNEAVYWIEMFKNYQDYAANSQTQLAETYGIVVFDNPSLHTAFDGEQLTGALLDDSVLLDETAWEAVYLDEFQVELLKAGAYMQYWEKQKEIAQAVYDYAADRSSDKENAGITLSRLEQARTDYETTLESYSAHLDQLTNISTQLGVLQHDMQTIQTEIEDYQSQLSSAREEYNRTITDLQVDNPQYLAEQYRDFYVELLESLGMKDGNENKTGSVFEEYLLAAVEYGFENDISLVSQMVVNLLSGADNTDIEDGFFNSETASLNELHQRAVTLGSAGFTADTGTMEAGLFSLSSGSRLNAFTEYLKEKLLLSSDDYRYDRLINYYEQFHNPASQEAGIILWEMQRTVEEICTQAEKDYELRLAEIRLYTSSDFSSWAQHYFSTDDFNEIISITDHKDLESVIEAIDDDAAVYNEIIHLYNNASSERFRIYDWSAADINNPDLLNKYQAFQKIWDYRRSRHDNDADTAAEINGLIDSLTALRQWLDSPESLLQRTSELEQAILSPNPSDGQNYLSCYLDGGHTLYSESGDLHSYIYSDKCSKAALEISISNMLKQRGFDAPVLRVLNYENSKNELIGFLAGEHLIDKNTFVFFSPAEVWGASEFADLNDVVEWFIHLDAETSNLNLPQYLSEILAGFVSELKDYSAILAAEVFTDEIPLDLTSLNADIRQQSNRLSEYNLIFQTLQKNNDDVVKLLNIAAADNMPDELRYEAERRLLETAGFDLAVFAVEDPYFVNSLNGWESLFDQYILKMGVSPSTSDEIEIYHLDMLERAVQLYELATALETPEKVDWSSVPSEWLEAYQAMLWNSLEFTSAADLLTGDDSILNISLLEDLKIIDEHMPDSESGFPDDVELDWLYRGNEILRYVDQQIIAGLPVFWADEGFDIQEEALSRTFSDEERAELDENLILPAAGIDDGTTIKQRASALWENSFSVFTEGNLFEDSLKVFSGLLLLNNYMEINGGYTSDYGYEEFLNELCEGLLMDPADIELYEGIAIDSESVLISMLEQNALENEAGLSGESLYWNLMWRARMEAGEVGYNQTDARKSIIFDNDSDFEVIGRWISQTEADYDVYSAKIENIIAAHAEEVVSLASTAVGSVYSEITAYYAASDLIENKGYEVESAVDFINWFTESGKLNYSLNSSSLLEYLSCPYENRLLHILNNHSAAAVHHLKKQIISGNTDNEKLAADLGKLTSLSVEQKAELTSLLSDFEYITVYKSILHGDFEEYLGSKYEDSVQKRKQREIYSRFPGTRSLQWDDPVFYAGVTDSGLNSYSILENLAFNRTRGTNISGINPKSGMSANDVFINESLQKMGKLLYSNEEASTARRLLSLQLEKDIAERAAPYLHSLQTPEADNWRSFLNSDYLSSLDKDGDLFTSELVSDTAQDYMRDLAVDYSTSPVFQDFGRKTLYRECGDDQHNFILDASNSLLDYSAFLAEAIENWRLAEQTLSSGLVQLSSQIFETPPSEFWNQLESFSYSDISALYNYEPDTMIGDEYMQNRISFLEQLAKVEALKAGMSSIGNRREKLLRLQSAGAEGVADELRPLAENISALEGYIDGAQNDWQMLIDGNGGYKSLEAEYSDCYSRTEESLQLLNKTKHDYSIARSIYEYASAGYLDIDDESLAEDAAVTVKNGDIVITPDINYDEASQEQNYQSSLLETINSVSPAGRLSYVNDKTVRAAAAYNALLNIINDNTENYSVYANDQVYKTCFDEYLISFRESLVLNKMNLVLNKAIARQELAVRDSFNDWNTAVADSYEAVEYLDDSGSAVIPEGLEGLYLQRVEGGSWNISWGAARDRYDPAGSAASEAYFKSNPDNENDQSLFSKDLTTWLEKINLRQKDGSAKSLFKTWALACKWEEYESLPSTETDQLTDSFWSEYLDKNNEEDLDKSGARLLLEEEWKNAHNKVSSYSGENLWMYNFYKLLAKSGAMQVDTTAGGGRSEENLELLADEESIILANQYMAEEYHEGAKQLMLSSVPMFAMAAIYFAVGASLLNPLTWVAAACMFAVAVAFTLGGTAILGEGNAKHAAANQIETRVVNKSHANISRFLSDFMQDTNGILEKKKKYENELVRLQEMQGSVDNNETLTDEQRIYMLQTSVVESFNDENEDLHRLLYKAGFAAAEGSEADDLNIIAALFSANQNRMSVSARNQISDSGSFISALEAESQEYKQIMSLGLNNYLTGPDGAASKQTEAENDYEAAYYRYIKGEISLEDFKTTAESAWGNPQFSTREHLLRLYEQQSAIAEIILGSDKLNSRISEDLLNSQRLLLAGNQKQKGIYDYRMQNYREVKLFELQMKRFEMVESRKLWESQMSAITARGELEWSAGERKFNRKFKDWQSEANRICMEQNSMWNEKYADFLNDKKHWFESVSVQSTDYGNMQVLEDFGKLTSGTIASAGTDILIGETSIALFDPDSILGEVIDLTLLGTLLHNAESINDSIKDTDTAFFMQSRPDKFNSSESLETIKDLQAARNEDFEKHLAMLEFNQLIEKAEIAESNFVKTIEDANENVCSGIHKTMRKDGYILNGGRYERNLVVGATLNDYIYEEAYVSKYNYYKPQNIDFSEELEAAEAHIDTMDASALEGILARAIENIKSRLQLIFGKKDDLSTYMFTELGLKGLQLSDGTMEFSRTELEQTEEKKGPIESFVEWIASVVSEPDSTTTEADNRRFADLNPGYFGMHVGFAPVFSDAVELDKTWNDDGQLKYPGAGEMGRIMGEFVFNKMKEGQGWSEVNMPHYKKRLWDDTNSALKAPNMVDVAGFTVSILTLGAGSGLSSFASMAVNLSDDLIIGAFDVGTGEKDFKEGLFDFSKKTAVAALGTCGSEFFGSVDTSSFGIGDNIMLNLEHQAYNTITGTAVDAISYSSENGFGYNLSTLDEGLFGASSIAGYAGTAANIGVSSLAAESLTPVQKTFYSGLSDMSGIAAQEAARYTVHAGYQLVEDGFGDIGNSLSTAFDKTGMSFNVGDIGSVLDAGRLIAATGTDNYNDQFMMGLNTVSDNLKGTGMFAININSNGLSGSFTSGGVNIGSHLYDLSKGAVADAALRNYKGKTVAKEVLQTGYAYGDQSFEDTFWRIAVGKDSLHFDADTEQTAETISKLNGGRAIHLSQKYANVSDEEILKAAVMLQHEAHRDGINNLFNDDETYRAVKAHTQMVLGLSTSYGLDFIAGDQNLTADVIGYMSAIRCNSFDDSSFNEYAKANYDSSADYWKLLNDGTIVWDGEKDLRNEAGEVIRIDKTNSFSKSLMNWLGRKNSIKLLDEKNVDTDSLTDAEIAYQLMKTSGAEWDNDEYSKTTGSNTGAYVPITIAGGQAYNQTGLSERLRFKLSEDEAFHLGKLSQESPDIAYWVGEGDNLKNAMASTGCYYMSTLGAVQTQAGELLTAEQINRITEKSIENGWLQVDDESIFTAGDLGRQNISRLAFQELGFSASLEFVNNAIIKDGHINIGLTINNNKHAAEWLLNELKYDPYEGIDYERPSIQKLNYRFVSEYQDFYWSEYEKMFY